MSRPIRADQLREGMRVSAMQGIHRDYKELWRHEPPRVVDVTWLTGELSICVSLSDTPDRPFYLAPHYEVTVED